MRLFTSVHLLLLTYIIAALLFWGFSLQKQSLRIYEQERLTLAGRVDSSAQPLLYASKLSQLQQKRDKRTKQYLGEGSTFLAVILIGAAVVYSSFRRSIRLSRQQNNFMLSVTHELKSPIAAVKLSLQTMQKHRLSPEQQQQLLDRCVAESNRLNDLCNNMLIASQMEGRQYVPAREELDFSELVENSVDDYATRHPKRFAEDIQPGIRINGDQVLLQMAVNNLLENAIKYTPPGTPVQVSLERRSNEAVLQVSDQGNGIPDTEKDKVFNKFYRVGNEGTRRTKGTGLGLYLTRRIVRQHQGRIAVKDNTPQGSVFEISLPVG